MDRKSSLMGKCPVPGSGYRRWWRSQGTNTLTEMCGPMYLADDVMTAYDAGMAPEDLWAASPGRSVRLDSLDFERHVKYSAMVQASIAAMISILAVALRPMLL